MGAISLRLQRLAETGGCRQMVDVGPKLQAMCGLKANGRCDRCIRMTCTRRYAKEDAMKTMCGSVAGEQVCIVLHRLCTASVPRQASALQDPVRRLLPVCIKSEPDQLVARPLGSNLFISGMQKTLSEILSRTRETLKAVPTRQCLPGDSTRQ